MKKWSASPSILLTPTGIVSALVLISIIVSQFGAVHAQDYVTAYAQNEAAFTVAFEGPVSSFYRVGSYRLLWRLRVTPSSASLGQTIEVNVDIKVSISWSRSSLPDQGTWPKVYPGATNTMLVKTGGLTEPLTRSFNPAMIVGLENGQTVPEQFEGTGSLTFEFLVPLDAGPGEYVIQAESETWNPCKAVTLHVVRQDQTTQTTQETQTTQTTGVVIPNPFGTAWWTTFGTEMAWGLGVMALTAYTLGPAVAAAAGPIDDLAAQFLSRWIKPYLRQEAEKLLQPPQPRKTWESGPSCIVCGRPTRFGVGICFACQTQRRFGR